MLLQNRRCLDQLQPSTDFAGSRGDLARRLPRGDREGREPVPGLESSLDGSGVTRGDVTGRGAGGGTMETGLPAPLAWGRGGIGKVGFGASAVSADAGSPRRLPQRLPSAPDLSPKLWTFSPTVYLTALQPSPDPPQSSPRSAATGREPRAPFAPVRRARGAEVTPQRWAWGSPKRRADCLGVARGRGLWGASATGPGPLRRSTTRWGWFPR